MCKPFTLTGWGPQVQDDDTIGNNAEGVEESFLSSQPSDCPRCPTQAGVSCFTWQSVAGSEQEMWAFSTQP